MKKLKKFEELSSRVNSIARGKTKEEDLNNAMEEISNIWQDLANKYGAEYIAKDFRDRMPELIDNLASFDDNPSAWTDTLYHKVAKRTGAINYNSH